MAGLSVLCIVPIASFLSLSLISPSVDTPPQVETKPSAAAVTPTRIYDSPAVLRKEDKRLEQRLVIDKPFVYLGELLEALSAQSGISLVAEDSDGAGGEEMTAVLTDLPLADVMENLTALLSHKGARWQWRREGDGSVDKPFVYRLLRPANAIPAYAEAMKQQIQTDFEKDAEMMLAGLDMSPEELKQKAKQYHDLEYLRSGGGTRLGIEAFRDSFSAEERERLLQGIEGKVIPLKDLPPSGLKLKDYMLGKFQAINPGRVYKIDGASFGVGHDSNGIPTLWIGFGELGGWSYIGSKPLRIDTSNKASKEWTHSGEDLSNPVEARTLPKPKEDMPVNRDARFRRFVYIAQAGGVSLLSRLQRDDRSGTAFEPWDKPLGEYLAESALTQSLIHKWRKASDDKPILLLEYTGWYWQDTKPETPRLPWSVVKRLRAERDTNTNDSLVRATLFAVANLSETQLKRLEYGEFPQLSKARLLRQMWFGGLASWVMEKPGRLAQIVSTQGVAVRELSFDKQYLLAFEKSDLAERVRIAVSGPEEKRVAYRVELLDGSGAVLKATPMPTWKASDTLSF